jgi:hypothetical protein
MILFRPCCYCSADLDSPLIRLAKRLLATVCGHEETHGICKKCFKELVAKL